MKRFAVILIVIFAWVTIASNAHSQYDPNLYLQGTVKIGQKNKITWGLLAPERDWCFCYWGLHRANPPIPVNRWVSFDIVPDILTWAALHQRAPFGFGWQRFYFLDDTLRVVDFLSITLPNEPALIGIAFHGQVIRNSAMTGKSGPVRFVIQ